ncbi:acyl carrier protein [Streptacidiphilus rugosus]|uniref:acyl carrier protein n=1 Tax=Streptacidiphilus rugosus TaxID=405783 RepID=UPI000B06B4D6|nr:acyl carrier protein [Streptacidiphilus rugosus]
MTTLISTADDYLTLVREATGLDLDAEALHRDFDALPGWDSLHLLKLVSALERATGTRVPVGRVLEARSLDQIRQVAVAG